MWASGGYGWVKRVENNVGVDGDEVVAWMRMKTRVWIQMGVGRGC